MNEAPQVVDRFSERSETGTGLIDKHGRGQESADLEPEVRGSGPGSRASVRQGINC